MAKIYLFKEDELNNLKILTNYRMHLLKSIILILVYVNIRMVSCESTSESFSTTQKYPNHQIHQDDLQEKTKHDLLIPAKPSNLSTSNNSSQTIANDSTLNNLFTYHDEPEPDSNIGGKRTASSEERTTPKSDDISVTTTIPFDEDDSNNRLYLQSLISNNYSEESTTSQPFEEINSIKSLNDATTFSPNGTDSQTNHQTSVDIMQTSETNPTSSKMEINDSNQIDDTNSERTSHIRRSLMAESNSNDTTANNHAIKTIPAGLNLSGLISNNLRSTNPTSSPLLTHPTLTDLLYIIKHLNLANDEPKSSIKQHTSLSPSNPLMTLSGKPTKIKLKQNYKSLNELITSESSNIKTDHVMRNVEEPNNNITKNVINQTVNSLFERENTIKKDEKEFNERTSAQGKTRYSLISPYIANFDSGVTFKNSALDKLSQLVDLSTDKLNNLPSSRKLYDKLKQHYHENRPIIVIDENSNRRGSNQVQTNFFSVQDGVKKTEIKHLKGNDDTKHNLDITTKQKINSYVPIRSNQNVFNNEKRGEREMYDKKGKVVLIGDGSSSRRPVLKDPLEENNENQSIHKGKRDNNNQVRYLSGSLNETTKNEEPNRINKVVQSVLKTTSEQQHPNEDEFTSIYDTNILENSLDGLNFQLTDDKQKKQMFYSNQDNALNFDDFPGPITIGDIAGQHGVPFRLQSPIVSDNFKYTIPNKNRLPMESNQVEDYVYMPYTGGNNNNIQTSATIGLDDELKKKLAIKTIEAISKYPELSKTLFDNLYDTLNFRGTTGNHLSTIQAPLVIPSASNWQRYYANLLSASSRPSANLHQTGSNHATIASNTDPLPVIVPLPSASLPETGYMGSSTIANDHFLAASSKINTTLVPPIEQKLQKWALTRMPDLIPIPLAATVPGYLIRLPNGQILAAALTNSFSIQGIQKGPFSSSYKRFLNQRFKNLIRGNQRPSGTNPYLVSDSSINAVTIQAPKLNHLNKNPASSEKVGLFSRAVLSQLGFNRAGSRFNSSIRDESRAQKLINGHKLIKLTENGDSVPSSAFTDQELSSMPLADFSEPVFSFADESQLIENNSDYPTTPALSTSGSTNTPIIQPAAADLFQNENTLAMKAKLNQLLSIRNFFNEDLFQGSKKRRSLPRASELPFPANLDACRKKYLTKPSLTRRLLAKLSNAPQNL